MNIDIERLKVDESLWPEQKELDRYLPSEIAGPGFFFRSSEAFIDHENAIPRPEPRHVEWDGEGLPPVGCECEYLTATGEWIWCCVRGQYEKALWIETMRQGFLTVVTDGEDFRPIRTKEERQRDDLISLLIKSTDADYYCCVSGADAIIAAGWRNPSEGVKRTDVIDAIASSRVDLSGVDRVNVADAILSRYNLEPKQ